MNYIKFLPFFTLIFTISFAVFLQIPNNTNYKIFLSPPATSIKKIAINNGLAKITYDSTFIFIQYNGINSILNFLTQKYHTEESKVLLKINADKKITFMGNPIKNAQFLVETGWKYCSYRDIIYIFQVNNSSTIKIPIPKYKLEILSTPKARIFIGNTFIGTTPFSSKLYYDNYVLYFKPEIEGYEDKNININLNKDLDLKIKLERLKKVIINTNIEKYTVMINGKRVKRESYLKPGKYLLTVKATGFYILNKTITVKNNLEKFFFELKPKLFDLTIQTLKNASIFVDNVLIGKGKISLTLSEGKHTIKIALNGFNTITKEIVLEKDESINIPLSPLSGTIVYSYNIKNCIFAYYTNKSLTILTTKSIFKIENNDITINNNYGYSYIYNGIYISRDGKLTLEGRTFVIEPFITGILKLKNYYVISTSSGNIYIFNGRSQPLPVKNLSLNFSYLKIKIYRKNILALASNGKIYEINIGKGRKKILVDKKFIKDFDAYNEKIYALSNNKIYVYSENRELKNISGAYESIYKNMAYGKSVLNIDKEKAMGKCDVRAINSGIYYYGSKIYDPENNKEYKTDIIPVKMIKYNDYLVIISKNKVEVMKL